MKYFSAKARVAVPALHFVEQPQPDKRIQKRLEVVGMDLERAADRLRLHTLAVEQAKQLQLLRGNHQPRDEERLLDVDARRGLHEETCRGSASPSTNLAQQKRWRTAS